MIRLSRSRTVLSILVFVTAYGDISGGHFNPVVTIGLATVGVFPSRRVTPYIVAQIAGGIAAAWVLLLALADPWPTLAPHWSISAMSTSTGAPA
jgi:glycerol uptake facilitator-like aquaporin